MDADEFDPYCDHLIVRDLDSGAVVGAKKLAEDCYNSVLGQFTGGEFADVDGESGGERPPRSLSS